MQVEIKMYRHRTEEEKAELLKRWGTGVGSTMGNSSVGYWSSDVGEEPVLARIVSYQSAGFQNPHTNDTWVETRALVVKQDGTFVSAGLDEIRAYPVSSLEWETNGIG